MTCVYCQRSERPTREHIISLAALKEFFGDPVRNIAKSPMFKEDQPDFEHVIKDVCSDCNHNKLRTYDDAGKILAQQVNAMQGVENQSFDFTNETLGYLVKSHCNFLRTKHIYAQRPIMDALLNHHPLPREMFRLAIFPFINETKFDPVHGEATWDCKLFIRESEGIAVSYIKLKHIQTFLFISSDDRADFALRVAPRIKVITNKYGYDNSIMEYSLKNGKFITGKAL
jgi:hypothetical protein